MKTVFYSVLFSFLLSFSLLSCEKPVPAPDNATGTVPPTTDSAATIRAVNIWLWKKWPPGKIKMIDTPLCILNYENGKAYVRIPFTGIPVEQRFLLVELNRNNEVLSSGIIALSGLSDAAASMNGAVQAWDLQDHLLLDSKIQDGFIVARHATGAVTGTNATGETTPFLKMAPTDPHYDPLPEVVVYPGGPTNGGYISLPGFVSLVGGAPAGGASGSGSGTGAGSGGGSGSYSASSGYAVYTRLAGGGAATRATGNRPATVTVEKSYAKPAINVASYFKCFDNISDVGASYTVQVLVDLPVNDDPSQVFDPSTGAVGHAFLAFTKTSGANSVTQYVGFAATKPFAAMFLTTAVPGKIIDNETHKYNASLTIPVTATGFDKALNATVQQDGSSYDIANFNCVDFSLGVVNSITPNFLTVQPLALPGSSVAMDTPGGLYLKLAQMKAGGNKNVSNGGVWIAGDSHGSCN